MKKSSTVAPTDWAKQLIMLGNRLVIQLQNQVKQTFFLDLYYSVDCVSADTNICCTTWNYVQLNDIIYDCSQIVKLHLTQNMKQ